MFIEDLAVLRTPSNHFFSTEKIDRVFLRKILEDSLFMESILIASPTFYKTCKKYLEGYKYTEKEIEELFCTLYKYFIRSSFRPTPFGAFAGLGVVEFGEMNNIVMDSFNKFVKHIRLDARIMNKLTEYLIQIEDLFLNIKFYSNSSLYNIGDKARYIEVSSKRSSNYNLISIDYEDYLNEIICAAKDGKTITELLLLFSDSNYSQDEVKEFLIELIENQILKSEIEFSLTGSDYLKYLIEIVETIIKKLDFPSDNLIAASQYLFSIDKSITDLKKITSSNQFEREYYELIEKLKLAISDLDGSNIIQCDIYMSVSKSILNNQIKNDILEGIHFLSKVCENNKYSLDNFKSNFQNRYESRKVPLLEVLDNELGIGYGDIDDSILFSDFLNELSIYKQTTDIEFNLKWNRRDTFLLEKYLQAIKLNSNKITLSDDDVSSLNKEESVDLPDTFSCITVIGTTYGGEELIYIKSIGGSSATNLIGRFGYMDNKLQVIIKNIVNKENISNPDSILAEIIHLPNPRLGNILSRIKMRQYEIDCLSKTSSDDEHTISISDLLISVKNNRILLESKKLDKEIIPRLGTAHNYVANDFPVYRLLCDLQNQDITPGLNFDLGKISTFYKYVPRIQYKNIVFERETWKVETDELLKLSKQSLSDDDLISKIKNWANKFSIPDKFVVVEDDNELLIDILNIISVKVLLKLTKRHKIIKIVEQLFDPSCGIVTDFDGRKYTSEFVFFVDNTKNKSTRNNLYKKENKVNNKIQRSFLPGSDWVYFKFYIGRKSSNDFIKYVIIQAINDFLRDRLISKWFFVRYSDPGPHLRIRFLLNNKSDLFQIIDKINKLCLNESLINPWKIQLDSYDREIERYGVNLINDCESIFSIDSNSYLTFLSLNKKSNEWIYGLLSIDYYLEDFGFSLDKKLKFCEACQNSFRDEFGFNKYLKDEINKKYATLRMEIEKNIFDKLTVENTILQDHSSKIKQVLLKQDFIDLIIDNKRNFDLIGSVIHMSINRIFSFNQRKNEFLLYEILVKEYKRQLFVSEK